MQNIYIYIYIYPSILKNICPIGCLGVSIADHNGKKRCFVVMNLNQTTENSQFSYNDVRRTCFSLGGQMPVLKSAIDEQLLSKGLDQYTLDSVSEDNQALKISFHIQQDIDHSQFA